MNKYYWGIPDTSVHFCENKYVNNEWVGEYYNTLSSLFYVIVGILFLNTRIAKLGEGLILVGIGAFMLHMTLRAYGQMFDEISMIVLTFDGASHIKKMSRYFLIPIIGLYLVLHNYFIYFFCIFTLLQIYIAKKGLEISNKRKRIFLYGYIILFLIALVCWFLDQFACEHVQDYQMHAWWHFFTSCAIGSGFMALNF